MIRIRRLAFSVGMAALLGYLPLAGQSSESESAGPPPSTVGGFGTSGSVTTGFRFSDVKGYEPMFNQLFDLQTGPRLLDFNVFGEAPAGSHLFADSWSVVAGGIGGDPYAGGQLTVRKNKVYDLSVDFRQSHYFWNENDYATVPGGFPGLLNFHDWNTVRKLGSADLEIFASNNLRCEFQYYRATLAGADITTQAIDYLGSPSSWGFFARANPYQLLLPVTEDEDRLTGGLDYTKGSWNVFYRAGFQNFRQDYNAANLSPAERSIDTGDPATAKEKLMLDRWNQSRNLNTPTQDVSYNGKLGDALDLRGSYTYMDFRGPAYYDAAFHGLARSNSSGTKDAPYNVSETDSDALKEPFHVAEQGAGLKINDMFTLQADYRYSRIHVTGLGSFASDGNGVFTTGAIDNQLVDGMHTVKLDLEVTPGEQPDLYTRT
jgi:hypothetical protein